MTILRATPDETRPHFISCALNIHGSPISTYMGAQSHQNLIFSLWWQDSWAVGTTPQDPLSGGNPHVDDDHDDGDNDDGDDDDSDDDDDRDDDDENRSSNSIHNGWSMIKQAQKHLHSVSPDPEHQSPAMRKF